MDNGTGLDWHTWKSLAEEYYNRYPNLVTSQEYGRIYASFEICGMMERTATGIVKIGYDNISYNDNFDYKKNWSVKLTGNMWELLSEWLEENRSQIKEMQKFQSWQEIFDEIGGTYERIWSDEERMGFVCNFVSLTQRLRVNERCVDLNDSYCNR